MVEALFAPDGDHFVPQDPARGPWDPAALHGGPVAALLVRAVERCQPDDEMALARITVELLRPVPLTPLSVSARVTRPGRKVQVVEVELSGGDRPLAWARALRIRTRPDDGGAHGLPAQGSGGPVPGRDDDAPPLPDTGNRSPPLVDTYRGFHNSGAELRFVRGEFDRRGPSSVWVRLAVPVVPEETPSPAQRAAAAADFGNGVSSILDFTQWVFINPDLTVYLERPPVGEWVCLQAATRLGTPGVGVARSVLWDERGRCGQSAQSLVIERRS